MTGRRQSVALPHLDWVKELGSHWVNHLEVLHDREGFGVFETLLIGSASNERRRDCPLQAVMVL